MRVIWVQYYGDYNYLYKRYAFLVPKGSEDNSVKVKTLREYREVVSRLKKKYGKEDPLSIVEARKEVEKMFSHLGLVLCRVKELALYITITNKHLTYEYICFVDDLQSSSTNQRVNKEVAKKFNQLQKIILRRQENG